VPKLELSAAPSAFHAIFPVAFSSAKIAPPSSDALMMTKSL
jgi:hypothetical protein